jgi:hypothetical protein
VTIASDAKGALAAKPLIEAAHPQHPSLIDDKLLVAEIYDARNVPAAFWIDENGRIVRANDPVYAQRRNRETGEVTLNFEYLDAVRDWVDKGPRSAYVMDDTHLDSRLPDLEFDDVKAAAHFQLGRYLASHGHLDDAVSHLKTAHQLRPDNWIYKRQAWSLGDIERDYGTTFQQALKDPKSGAFYPPLDLT